MKDIVRINFKAMRKIYVSALSFIFCFILFIACNDGYKSKPPGDTKSRAVFDLVAARKQIDSANVDFMHLVSKGDSVALASYYTRDAKMMGPKEPAVVGRKNIQSAFANLVSAGIQLNLTTLDV